MAMRKQIKFDWIFVAVILIFALSCGIYYNGHRPEREAITVTSAGKQEESAPEESDDPAPGILEGERINVNTASAEDLDRLPGIGEVRAAAIVAWREAYGPFETVEELLEVDGIGEGILDGLRDYVTVGD